jgi:hypothetical protein
LVSELRGDNGFDLLASSDDRFIRFRVAERRASGLERAELDPEKVIFPEREGELRRVPAEQ